jgi:long-chain acyl-CoA synthetase
MECLNDILARTARLLPDKPFLVFQDEAPITYAAFASRVRSVAAKLAELNVGKGDRVGICLSNGPPALIAFWACQHLGAIPVPLSAMLRAEELRQAIQSTGLATMLVDATTEQQAQLARDACPQLRHVVAQAVMSEAAGDAPSPVRQQPSDIAVLFFTSGTTGTPKGIAQCHLNQYSTLRDMASFHRTRFASEIYYGCAPLFTNLGTTATANLCVFTGGTLVFDERWETRRVLDAIRRHRVTMLLGTPTMFIYLANEFDAARDDLSSLRLCTNGGAPVPLELAERFQKISGAPLLQVYGATETSGQNVIEPWPGIRKPGSAGVAIGSSRIEVLRADGTSAAIGEVGEILITGDCVALGYWRDGSVEPFGRGWSSGDLGYLDADGYLFIVDRKKDVIITGGHNVYPIEVETVLYRHEAVALCAVVGLPDPVKGEIPVAVIVRKTGAPLSHDDAIAHCRASLAAYKIPRRIYFAESLPVAAGKIRKRELVTLIASGGLG